MTSERSPCKIGAVPKTRPRRARRRGISVQSLAAKSHLGGSLAVPSWLEIPPDAEVPAPVQTRPQLLPVHQMTWENFERICLRLARLESDVEHCQLYGERGEAQHGIDLYARQHDSTYVVYQCKKVKTFTATSVKAAVATFLNGRWAATASRLVICTSASTTRRAVADEIERQHSVLKSRGCDLLIWDSEELSRKLKELPTVVDDFFGRTWVTAICGEASALQLGRRLDNSQVIRFRRSLREFYSFVFNLHDPGIPVPPQPGTAAIPLSDRYVLPDVSVARAIPNAVPTRRPSDTRDSSEDLGLPPQLPETDTRGSRADLSHEYRESVTAWLAKSDRSLVLGGPGSGKSSLLRHLVLDQLSEHPSTEPLANRWAQRLPVWVPFAFWTKQIASSSGQQASLEECLRQWFAQWNKSDLTPLIEQAIQDERLLLIVDGLDEWTSEDAGRVGCQLLQGFAHTHNVAVVITSRPYGFRRISSFSGGSWQVAELAELSPQQRSELCGRWFLVKARLDADTHNLSVDEQSELARRETDRFLADLARSSELAHLAAVPLLLLLLLYMRFQRAVLPRRRFEAYDRILDHLVREHPAAKRAAAFLIDPVEPLQETDVRDVLACVAFTIQADYPESIVAEGELETVVNRFLVDQTGLGLGLGHAEARQYLPQFSRIAEGTLGILVRQGVQELSFLHRSFQEFLAAHHMSRLPLNDQVTLVDAHVKDARWREVFLGLFWRTRRPDDLETLLQSAERHAVENETGFAVRELLTEAAFGDFGCSPQLTTRLSAEAFRRIEGHPWMPHRQRLLGHALDGLRSSRLRDAVRHRVQRWTFCTESWRATCVEELGQWSQPNRDAIEGLLTALHDEDTLVQRSAARALAQAARNDLDTGTALAALSLRSHQPLVRAAALEALCLGWPGHSDLSNSVAAGLKSESLELQLSALLAKVHLGRGEEQDFEHLVELSGRDDQREIQYAWNRAPAEALTQGWPQSHKLKKLCLESAARFQHDAPIDRDIALTVILNAFPGDPDVARFCANEIEHEDHPFLGMLQFHGWPEIARHFRDNPIVIAAIDNWLPKQTFGGPEVAFAARVGRTPLARQRLLDLLEGSFPHWIADSLLECWGMLDVDVAKALSRMAHGPAARASEIANEIPRIVANVADARARLMELIRDPLCRRPDFVVQALGSLPDRGNDQEIAEACLTSLTNKDRRSDLAYHALFRYFGHVPAVRTLALEALDWRDPPIAALAHGLGSDTHFRHRIIERLTPLPVVLRRDIVQELGRSYDDAFATDVLSGYDRETNDELKMMASIAFHRRASEVPAVADAAIQGLRAAISSYGPDHESRRRAAFAGLVLLDRLDVMQGMTETIGDPRPVAITIADHFHPSVQFIRLLGERWSQLKSNFGDLLLERLSKRTAAVWEPLCLAGADFPELRDDLLSAIRTSPALHLNAQVLSFLALAQPGTLELRDRCVSTLRSPGRATWDADKSVRVASDILADQFKNDATSRLLLTPAPTLRDEGIVLALCTGWPETETLTSLYSEVVKPRSHGIRYSTFFELIYARTPSESIIERLAGDIGNSPTAVHDVLLAAVLRRLQRDTEAREIIKRELFTTKRPSAKATLARLLFSGASPSRDLTEWCAAEITHQFDGRVPDLGFDLIARQVRSVGVSLLDAVDGAQRVAV